VEVVVELGDDVAPMVDEPVPAAASIDLSVVPNCLPELMSVSTKLFAPSQLYAQSSLRSDCHGMHNSVLLMEDSIPRMLEHLEIENSKCAECPQILEFATKVCFNFLIVLFIIVLDFMNFAH
jgi:hypothetical protein